jgi:hypothetical protein
MKAEQKAKINAMSPEELAEKRKQKQEKKRVYYREYTRKNRERVNAYHREYQKNKREQNKAQGQEVAN